MIVSLNAGVRSRLRAEKSCYSYSRRCAIMLVSAVLSSTTPERSMAKRTTTGRKLAAGSRKPAQRKRQPPPPAFDLSLRPEHQRELFGLALITIAAVTIVFFLTGSAGAFGQRWVAFTKQLLGWGALLVPLSLGLLGVAILWQERREDLQLTGATVLGTAMLLVALLGLLE